MTFQECEIVAQAGARLREIAESIFLGPAYEPHSEQAHDLVCTMDAASLSISEVYGLLSSLPLETEV